MAFSQFPAKGGIPSGNTAARPSSPVIGDTYYDGTLGFLLIWEGTQWIPCSAPAAQPTITVTDVGSGMAYGTVKASVAFTEGASGGKAAGFTATQGTTSVTATSSPIVLTLTANAGSYSFSGTAYNGFGTSPAAQNVTQSLTSVPQAPTIGTATPQSASISLTFTEGASGGTAITNYQWSTDGTTYTALSPADTTSPVIIPGLTNGTSYTVRLKAVNANGVSAASGASNSATPVATTSVEYLVVAGGGGGNCNPSNNGAGAGGAGGYRTNIGSPITALIGPAYNIVVGSGGAGSTTGSSIAGKGGDSRFDTIYSTGGGGGAYEAVAPGIGGSGGGACNQTGAAGNQGGYSPVEGFRGGNGAGDGGGGGGGATAQGQDALSQNINGTGGTGSNSCSAWATITSSGDSGYFAGGGTGAGYSAASSTAGGLGGGGIGRSRNGAGGAGTANTGGGGGAAGGTGGPGTGGNGGSGIVILKYPSSVTATFSGLTQTTYTSGSDKYSKITAGTGTVTFS